ncbi:MAG: type II secretion system F family protein [Salaquimonas sp.]
MFGIEPTILAFVGLAALGFGGIIYAFMFDAISNEAKQAKRLSNIKQRDKAQQSNANQRLQEAAKRRKTVQDSLKELDDKTKSKHAKKITLKKMIAQADMKVTVPQFYVFSAIFGLLLGAGALVGGFGLMVVAGIVFVGAFGIPRWYVSMRRKRRFKAFSKEFPNSVDVIVRGVKAGLPLNDCLAIIAKESKAPVGPEFRKIVESQQMGMTMGDAIGKLYDNIPLAETNFFGIVISIQQGAGGNLSEALGNLSNVLRDRKKMDEKIKAMSAEAKASAGIIGSLPFCVTILIYLTTPDYISLLFTHPTGHMILAGSAIWMTMGILVMKKMINFDF